MSKKRKSEVGDALSNLTKSFEQREKELDEREEKLKQHEKRLELDYFLAFGVITPSDVVYLNVCGTKTTVLRSTLTSVPGSMLASRFSGRWDRSLPKDKDGNFYIDQEFALFGPMLNHLRNKVNGDDKYSVDTPDFRDRHSRYDFYRMVEHYGLTNAIYPTKVKALSAHNSVAIFGATKVLAKEFATFQLKLCGHSRKIRDYEVTLGEVHRLQIGWGYPDEFHANENLGAGEVSNSYALDLTRSMFLKTSLKKKNKSSLSPSSEVERLTVPVEGLEHPAGTVVLSKDFGRLWFVNGELVLDTTQGNQANYNHTYKEPLISIKGEFEVTSIEFR